MSYASRTKLSCESSACTVLTDDYVFVTSGLGANQRMPLADWRIIIGGETIRDEYIPLVGAIHSGSSAAAEYIPLAPTPTVWSAPEPLGTPAPAPAPNAPPTAAALAVAAAAAATVPEPPAIGTKWVWSLADIPQNYCVAIQTKHGVLQVKKVSCSYLLAPDYAVNLTRQMFATYQAWCDSLRLGGTIETTLPQESDLDKRRARSSMALADGGTTEAIQKIMQYWRVYTQVRRELSITQRIKFAEDEITLLREALQKITLEEDVNWPRKRSSKTRRLRIITGLLITLRARAAQQTPEQNNHRNAWFKDLYKQRLYVHTSEGKLQIAYDKNTQSIAVRIPTGANAWMNKYIFVNRLEELPFSIGANLRLSVHWQRKEIELTA